MPPEPQKTPKVLALYLELSQYPILAPTIRARMRQELFTRGVITREAFEAEVQTKARHSQQLEGLIDPIAQEPPDVWDRRQQQTRDNLTDFYFAYNLPHDLFKDIVQATIAQRNPNQKVILTFNPELAPIDMVLQRGEEFEALPPAERAQVKHHLQEIIVVLLKTVVSDQLSFIRVAKEWFTVPDIREIRKHRIGDGKIGGKAAGMLLAWKILQHQAAEDGWNLTDYVTLPESYYIGANILYEFNLQNGLFFSVDQKYKPREEIEDDYPGIVKAYLNARFPLDANERLRELLEKMGRTPLIVRSSSLLEDNFGTSFAGKYESFFLPNQGTVHENLDELIAAVKRIYASVLSPDPLVYRRRMGLLDYDERMAILIQPVQGDRHGRYIYPTLAGVGYSRNPFRWNPQIRREDGFLRLVWGLGTRAVDRVDNDFPRMVALSHPNLRPDSGASEVRRHSQHYVDLIDLETNEFTTRRVSETISPDDAALPYLASEDHGDYIQPLFSDARTANPEQLVLTFDGLLKKTPFVPLMKTMLRRLETVYHFPIDIEFTADIIADPKQPNVRVQLLQCRPQSQYAANTKIALPSNVPESDKVFSTDRLVPSGVVSHIRYIVYVSPEKYITADPTVKLELARVVGRLNKCLEGQNFILMGPGRWGSTNPDLGVHITYADINNTRVLVEIALPRGEGIPEVSYGTHFFQDLVEARIYPLPLFPAQPGTLFNRAFFSSAPNVLARLSPQDAVYADFVQVIDVPSVSQGRHMELVMDEDKGAALAYLL
ncbi:MAG: phosphoenolpyruvate synthase [Chloroflexi bacterium]|nr:phosphoenolpyruvate synthase [Chloroflexota bacterium]